MRHGAAVLALAAVLGACEPVDKVERPQSEQSEAPPGQAPTAMGTVPETEPIAYQVFDEEPATFAPGRRLLHILVPADASAEQIRQMMVKLLMERGEQDTTLLALRAIAYKPVSRGAHEADLVPVVWGEWLPPEGWVGATAESRKRLHRVYTYSGVEPEW